VSALRGTPEPLASTYDGSLLDLDGTVHRSGTVIPGVLAALTTATVEHGMRPVYVTNNASRTPAELVDDLRALGIETDPSHVFTSAQAAARLTAARVAPGATVLVVGGTGVREPVEHAGLRVVDRADAGPVAVVQGWFPDLGWRLLAQGAYALEAGALWVATNLDLTLPTHHGLAPGNGSFVQALANASGRRPDVVAGKPEPGILIEAAAAVGLRHPLVVGDRLDTDIEGANAAGLDSLLVLTGVTDAAQLLGAPAEQRPTYVGAGLDALLAPAPEPQLLDGGVVACGAARVRRTPDGVVELVVAGEPLDLLRSACAAAWSADGSHPSPELLAALVPA
jgi:HAD superfamily hydrolase (TIGR01450 family)